MHRQPIVLLIAMMVASNLRDARSQTPAPIRRPTISSSVPSEVVDGDGRIVPHRVRPVPIEQFDDFSWRSFVALNWPAQSDARGAADGALTINDVTRPRVWETWKSAYETVPPAGETPKPWDSFDAVVPIDGIPSQNAGKRRILGSFTKFGDISQADFGSLAGPLVAQNRTFVHYEIRVNKPMFEFIRARQLYDREQLDRLTAQQTFPNGSIVIKAAWREFVDGEPDSVRNRFYRITASTVDYNSNSGASKELGLIGFHIVHKTPMNPQWVWTSFEHVDNVPALGQTPALGAKYSLFDPGKEPVLIPAGAPDPVKASTYLTPAGVPIVAVSGTAVSIPMQVVRELPLHATTELANVRYQAALRGSVWQNYMLVVTQWPTDPNGFGGAPFPTDPRGRSSDTVVTNTAMETYFQGSVSCMTCHFESRREKLDYVFFPIVHSQSRNPGDPGSPGREFLDGLNNRFDTFRDQSKSNRLLRLGQ